MIKLLIRAVRMVDKPTPMATLLKIPLHSQIIPNEEQTHTIRRTRLPQDKDSNKSKLIWLLCVAILDGRI